MQSVPLLYKSDYLLVDGGEGSRERGSCCRMSAEHLIRVDYGQLKRYPCTSRLKQFHELTSMSNSVMNKSLSFDKFDKCQTFVDLSPVFLAKAECVSWICWISLPLWPFQEKFLCTIRPSISRRIRRISTCSLEARLTTRKMPFESSWPVRPQEEIHFFSKRQIEQA